MTKAVNQLKTGVLTDDGIVEEGNHDQLMEQKGIYYQFYETANALK